MILEYFSVIRNNLIILLICYMGLIEKSIAQYKMEGDLVVDLIEKEARSFLKNKEMNSVSIGVVLNGKTYIHHLGELTKGEGNTPTDQTVYEIASVTKTMAGYLVARAEQENKIALDDDIRIYLKEEYPNLEYNSKPITIKHLITHSSGLPTFIPVEMNKVFEDYNEKVPQLFNQIEKGTSKEKFLKELHEVKLTNEPGSDYRYSNAGAELMGYILESVFNKNIDELLRENLFVKNQMNNTGVFLSDEEISQLAPGYWMKNATVSPHQMNPLWASGSGLKSTLPDLVKYIKFQLDSTDPLIAKTHQILFENEKLLKVGYFWRIWNDKYGTSYNHHGGTVGTQNWLYIYPRYNLGISIITNHSGPKTPRKLNQVVKKLLKAIVDE